MRARFSFVRTAAVLSLCAFLPYAFAETPPGSKPTALDRYVATPDPAYKWELVSKLTSVKGLTVHVLDMTSQTWRTEKEVNRTLWKHWVNVYVPEKVDSARTGFLFISGGSNKSKAPTSPDVMLSQIALETKSVVTELKMVPNQPLVFPEDGKERSEDEIIAYTWDKHLRGGDDNWPLRLPMTKAAVRAMDTVTAFCGEGSNCNGAKVDRFVVSGGSKRGWTTWTTAAVDKRVVAIAPLVIDMLNIVPSFEHHWKVYGFWAPAIGDYQDMKIMEWSRSKEYQKLMKIEEPYEYRDRLTLPKFIVNAAGDQFFIPDSSQFYWDGLKGPKYLRYVPNADHSLRGSDAPQSLIAFYSAVLNDRKMPEFTWKVRSNGDIEVKSKDKPSEVKVWLAHNAEARDFRMEKIGKAYTESKLQEEKPGVWVAKAPKVEKGYSAYFVELTYPTDAKYPIKLTTQVKVWPDTYPHAAFKPAQASGTPAKSGY